MSEPFDFEITLTESATFEITLSRGRWSRDEVVAALAEALDEIVFDDFVATEGEC